MAATLRYTDRDGRPVEVLRTWVEDEVEFAEIRYPDGYAPYDNVNGRLGGTADAPTWEHRVRDGKVIRPGGNYYNDADWIEEKGLILVGGPDSTLTLELDAETPAEELGRLRRELSELGPEGYETPEYRDLLDRIAVLVRQQAEARRAHAHARGEQARAVELEAQTGRYVRAIELGSPIALLELAAHLTARNENSYVRPLEPFELRPILAAITVGLEASSRLATAVLEVAGAAELVDAGDGPALRDANCIACLEGTGRHAIDCRAVAGARSRDEAEHGPIVLGDPVGLEPAEFTIGELYAAWRGDKITDDAYTLELERRGVTRDGVDEMMGRVGS